jgi:hypothetical protein
MKIVVTNHPLYEGQAFDVAHFHGDWLVTKGGSRFYAEQWRVAEGGEEGVKLNPDLVEVTAK